MALARAGQKVALVDLDLRRPAQAAALRVRLGAGPLLVLTLVLVGIATNVIAQVIHDVFG